MRGAGPLGLDYEMSGPESKSKIMSKSKRTTVGERARIKIKNTHPANLR